MPDLVSQELHLKSQWDMPTTSKKDRGSFSSTHGSNSYAKNLAESGLILAPLETDRQNSGD